MELIVCCPRCGEDENLHGEMEMGDITVHCGSCNLIWLRDLQPRCSRCDSSDVRPAHEAIVSKSRGSQLSIQSARLIYLCQKCDAAKLSHYQMTNSPIMPENLPTEQ
jgi:hypothetical protein